MLCCAPVRLIYGYPCFGTHSVNLAVRRAESGFAGRAALQDGRDLSRRDVGAVGGGAVEGRRGRDSEYAASGVAGGTTRVVPGATIVVLHVGRQPAARADRELV